MGDFEILILGLLVAVAGLGALANRISVPYPIVLVVGGALVGFVPGLPAVRLDPEVVLVIFLPPLLYKSAIYANFGDFRANMRALTFSTVALVLVTMCAVAWVAHAGIPDLPWSAAFVLGAIVSPTDPVAAATIMRRLTAPRRLVSAVEGEGLFNDATALVAYRVAVAAVASADELNYAGRSFDGNATARRRARQGPGELSGPPRSARRTRDAGKCANRTMAVGARYTTILLPAQIQCVVITPQTHPPQRNIARACWLSASART